MSKQIRFYGHPEQLSSIVARSGVSGTWEEMPACYWRYVCASKAILNWWPSTGTINFQGPPRAKEAFRRAIARTLIRDRAPETQMLAISVSAALRVRS